MIETRDIEANDMTFKCRAAGDGGEPVILLHGFPETSHMWIELMERLIAEGYRCLAPDQRGYSPGARPDYTESYSYRNLASDVFALADAWDAERFHLIGHDWGSLVGWAALGVDASRIASWTALSVPHALGFARAVRDDPEEEPYRGILTFLLTEGGPETVFVANDAAALRGAYTHSSPEEIHEYVAVLSEPGAMKAAASWYRASRAHARSLEDPRGAIRRCHDANPAALGCERCLCPTNVRRSWRRIHEGTLQARGARWRPLACAGASATRRRRSAGAS